MAYGRRLRPDLGVLAEDVPEEAAPWRALVQIVGTADIERDHTAQVIQSNALVLQVTLIGREK